MTITQHCFERFTERAKRGDRDPARATVKILDMLSKAERVRLKARYRVSQLLRHDFRLMSYLKFDNWIFVLDDEENVVTCYQGQQFKWEKEN